MAKTQNSNRSLTSYIQVSRLDRIILSIIPHELISKMRRDFVTKANHNFSYHLNSDVVLGRCREAIVNTMTYKTEYK